jgi:hypothetical protein
MYGDKLTRGIAAPRACVKAAPKKAAEAGPSKSQVMLKVGDHQIAEVSSVSFQEAPVQQASAEDPLVRAQRAHLEFERAQIAEKERLLALQRGLIDGAGGARCTSWHCGRTNGHGGSGGRGKTGGEGQEGEGQSERVSGRGCKICIQQLVLRALPLCKKILVL